VTQRRLTDEELSMALGEIESGCARWACDAAADASGGDVHHVNSTCRAGWADRAETALRMYEVMGWA
jgi:hypothetical protein